MIFLAFFVIFAMIAMLVRPPQNCFKIYGIEYCTYCIIFICNKEGAEGQQKSPKDP